MSDVQYAKMTDFVGEGEHGDGGYSKPGPAFTIDEYHGYKFVKWDQENNKYLVADKWQEGYSKKYTFDTSLGRVDMSQAQVTNWLIGVLEDTQLGKALVEMLSVQQFTAVKSLPAEVMHTKYYFKAVQPAQDDSIQEPEDEPIDLSDIPF